MYHLATLFPILRRLRLPLSRDQVVLLLVASAEIGLAADIYVAHILDQTIKPYEWIPIIFGPIAGLLLLLAGVIALRRRTFAALLATTVLISSAAVGLAGSWFHLQRAALPVGDLGERLSTRLLVWGPPFLGPMMFLLIALWGISAAWVEDPIDSGRLRLSRRVALRLPLRKTDVYFLLVAAGVLVATVSAVLDHARTGWENSNLWIPTVVGLFAAVVAAALSAIQRPSRTDLMVYLGAMLAMIITGVLGAYFHVSDNLTSRGSVVAERFIRGAPVMAPFMYSIVGSFGLVALLDPAERRRAREAEVLETAEPDPVTAA